MRRTLALALLAAAGCKNEPPRETLGPISIAVPPTYAPDPTRAARFGNSPLVSARVFVNLSDKRLSLALTLARLPHQPEWAGVPRRDLLTEMVNQELTAGEKASLKTVRSDRRFQGDALVYSVDGDLAGQLATSSQTAVWLDSRGDCWHASAVCTAPPAERSACAQAMQTVRLALETFDAG